MLKAMKVFACWCLFLVAPCAASNVVDWNGQPGSLGFDAIRDGNNVWIDLTVTRGLSYNDSLAATGAGLQFDGWRFATAAEAQQLLDDADIGHSGVGVLIDPQKAVELFSIWGGPLSDASSVYYDNFIVGDPVAPGHAIRQMGTVALYAGVNPNVGYGECCGGVGAEDSKGRISVAVAFVRTIPEPSSVLLCCASLLAIPLFRCRINSRRHTRRRVGNGGYLVIR